jgi:hypothetical protein
MMNSHKPDNTKLQPGALVDCMTCGLPAEIADRFTLGGAPAPVEHVKIVCVRKHWYTLPIDMIRVSACQSTRAPASSQALRSASTDARAGAQRSSVRNPRSGPGDDGNGRGNLAEPIMSSAAARRTALVTANRWGRAGISAVMPTMLLSEAGSGSRAVRLRDRLSRSLANIRTLWWA